MTTEVNPSPRLRVTWHGRSAVGCVRGNNEDSLWAGSLSDGVPDAGSESPQGGPRESPQEGSHEGPYSGQGLLGLPGSLLVVADGMGGAKAGEIASGMAVRILGLLMLEWAAQAGSAPRRHDDLERALVTAVETANERIRDESSANPNRRGMGTTLTAIWAYDDVAQIAHVGDSRAYLFRKGRLSRLTRDQSLVEKLLEDNIISPEEASRMGGAKNIILQALGSEEDLDVAHPREGLEPGDLLLLCTDGLSGVVSDPELEEGLRAGGSLAQTCDRLIAAAEKAGGPDNITVLLGHVERAHR